MDWPTATSSMSPLVRPVLVMWWWVHQRWPGPVLCHPTAARHPTSPHQPPIGGLVVAGTSTTTSTTPPVTAVGTRPGCCWCTCCWCSRIWWWWCTMVKWTEGSVGGCSGGWFTLHLALHLAHLAPLPHPVAGVLAWLFPNLGHLSFQTPWHLPPHPVPLLLLLQHGGSFTNPPGLAH